MKYKSVAILIVCMSLAGTILAQSGDEEIAGTGTPTFIPQFVGKHRLGNSNIFQAGSDVGVNTTNPQATLDVESNGTLGILAATSSTEPFATGVLGRSPSTSGHGVEGEGTATTGVNVGVLGRSASTSGNGVAGIATATTGLAYGVVGQTYTTGFGAGLLGAANATSGTAFGVFGASSGTSGNGIFGYAGSPSGYTIGVSGFVESPTGTAGRFVANSGSGLILQGISGSTNQVFAVDANGDGFFAGNVNITGNVSKGSGSFKIDHPLDPANKYLSHSFIESPDMMNVYNGVVVLDAHGSAWVELPDYFQTLNRDYRYQLTSIGAPGPNLYIAKEVSGNRFKIAGGKPSGKVSWQVTGIRQDAYANAHRIAVEEEKPRAARGQYLHPELFGKSREQAIGAVHTQLVQPVMAVTRGATR
jgi:hypothetical protein